MMHGHTDRPGLVGEHPRGDLGQIALFVIFMAVWIADSFFFKYTSFLSGYIPLYVRIPFSAVILIISGYFALAGHRILFEEEREIPVVINHGIFGVVRHPLYFSVILLYLGLLLLTFSMAAVLVWIIIFIFYNFIASYEENLLSGKFGKEYERYKQMVPRWIPRFGKRDRGDG